MHLSDQVKLLSNDDHNRVKNYTTNTGRNIRQIHVSSKVRRLGASGYYGAEHDQFLWRRRTVRVNLHDNPATQFALFAGGVGRAGVDNYHSGCDGRIFAVQLEIASARKSMPKMFKTLDNLDIRLLLG
jgi:hypothetical protein